MMKKKFLNPEIDVLWFDEEELITASGGDKATHTPAGQPSNSNTEIAVDGMNSSLTTKVKITDLQ